MLDCLLVSAIMFYMYKAKNVNGRRNIFTLVVRVHCPLLLRQRRQSIYRIQLPSLDNVVVSLYALHFYQLFAETFVAELQRLRPQYRPTGALVNVARLSLDPLSLCKSLIWKLVDCGPGLFIRRIFLLTTFRLYLSIN